MTHTKVRSWGRLSHDEHHLLVLNHENLNLSGIPFGNGRSYGDVCLNSKGILWQSNSLNRFLSFDENTGILRVESGILLHEINQVLQNSRWMLPVTPGTAYVTIGGAIANDVHGKNHHQFGTFGQHIRNIKLMRSNGNIIDCSPIENINYYQATIGGLGLTGLILEAEIQLKPSLGSSFLSQSIPFYSIEEFFELAETSTEDWEYTVAWIDCLYTKAGHRGIFFRAKPIDGQLPRVSKKNLQMPFTAPFSLVNPVSLAFFNQYYFYQYAKHGLNEKVVDYQTFFYPLDSIFNWNKIYGPKGFYQYQLVLPKSNSLIGIKAVLDEISKAKQGSFLAVLKTFGNISSPGMLSFPMEGTTLALDFPNKGKKTKELFMKLNQIVDEFQGRLYPAKDACMPKHLFERGYPALNEFMKYRDLKMSSNFFRRVLGIEE